MVPDVSPILQIDSVSKEYVLGAREGGPTTFREALASSLSAPFRGLRRRAKTEGRGERFFALQDVTFDVSAGTVLGIIGRNGAGKSTLLKILSRVTAPSSGRVTLRGRLACLLEVGTGFHPELTGRENVFLNGAILGMRRREIAARFDEIVAFAEVERFLDTPVKRYSSGMYVRLAFAVAAHLEPEILVVDEVLAVGDAAFQRKCLGKMEDAASSGRTVIFVSHNMAAIGALCSRVVCLSAGRVVCDAPPADGIAVYLSELDTILSRPLLDRADRQGDGRLRFVEFWLEDALGRGVSQALLGETVTFCFAYQAVTPLTRVYVAFDLQEHYGQAVINCNTADIGGDFETIPSRGVFRCAVPRFPVRGGRYIGNVYCSSGGQVHDWVQAAIQVEVADADFYGTGVLKNRTMVAVSHSWGVEDIEPRRAPISAGREQAAPRAELA